MARDWNYIHTLEIFMNLVNDERPSRHPLCSCFVVVGARTSDRNFAYIYIIIFICVFSFGLYKMMGLMQ